jgi:hypothetical protein
MEATHKATRTDGRDSGRDGPCTLRASETLNAVAPAQRKLTPMPSPSLAHKTNLPHTDSENELVLSV